MSASTPTNGVIYATGGDPIHTVNELMQAMAERVDLMAGETGTDTLQAAGAGTVSKRINYARSYATPQGPTGLQTAVPLPRAWIQQETNHADTILTVSAEDRTGFTATLRTANAGTATRTFRWFARPMG